MALASRLHVNSIVDHSTCKSSSQGLLPKQLILIRLQVEPIHSRLSGPGKRAVSTSQNLLVSTQSALSEFVFTVSPLGLT